MKLIYTDISGNVHVVVPAPKNLIERDLKRVLTDSEYFNKVQEVSVPDRALNVQWVMDNTVPTDREFRDSWKEVNGQIVPDLVIAKDIQLNRIRKVRTNKLKKLDEESLRLIEAGESIADVKARKQALRDITEPLKALVPTSIDDIKNAFPVELKEV